MPVCRSVCRNVCNDSEPFGMLIQVGPGNYVLDGSPDSPMRRDLMGEELPSAKYRDSLR